MTAILTAWFHQWFVLRNVVYNAIWIITNYRQSRRREWLTVLLPETRNRWNCIHQNLNLQTDKKEDFVNEIWWKIIQKNKTFNVILAHHKVRYRITMRHENWNWMSKNKQFEYSRIKSWNKYRIEKVKYWV